MKIKVTLKDSLDIITVEDGKIISGYGCMDEWYEKPMEDLCWHYIKNNELISWEVIE